VDDLLDERRAAGRRERGQPARARASRSPTMSVPVVLRRAALGQVAVDALLDHDGHRRQVAVAPAA
jgi:hypothetical protein